MADDLTRQLLNPPIFLRLMAEDAQKHFYPHPAGPPTPYLDMDPAFIITLDSGGLRASGGGWEGESTFLTADDVTALRKFLDDWGYLAK